eukprot:scaffold27031_cov63-Phaeocystis_antarctica.AAC.6
MRAEEAGHEAREGDAKLEVDELPSVDGARLVEVGMCERAERNVEVGRCEAAEASSEDVAIIRAGQLGRVQVDGRRVDDFEANVLALAVAVEPQHERITAGRLGAKVLRHARAWVLKVDRGCIKELDRLHLALVVELATKVQAPHVPNRASAPHLSGRTHEVAFVLKHWR